MLEKPKRKRGAIPPWMRFTAAFLPCVGIGILELVFFISTGYVCAAFPLSIVALILVGNMVWEEDEDTDNEKPKRDRDEGRAELDFSGLTTIAHGTEEARHDEEFLERYDDTRETQSRDNHS